MIVYHGRRASLQAVGHAGEHAHMHLGDRANGRREEALCRAIGCAGARQARALSDQTRQRDCEARCGAIGLGRSAGQQRSTRMAPTRTFPTTMGHGLNPRFIKTLILIPNQNLYNNYII